MSSEFAEPGAVSERVVARLRPHARALFWPSLLLILGAGALAYFATVFPEDWQNLALVGGGSVLLAMLWFVPLLRWLANRTVITTRRIVIRHGIATRTRQELLHSRGYDVTVKQGALQSMFGSGDVLINSGLEHPVVLRDVPGAELVQGALHDLMEKSMNPIAARRQHDMVRPNDETTAWGTR
jgi:membrane protein YdbS with pleckstrin-like domain